MLLQRSRIAVLARHRARIEIIPLIDVIFFLLATFVLFTLALNRIQSLPVVLPHSGRPEENPELVTLQVSDSGTIYWNRELIEPTEVPARLAHYKTRTESPRVVITGDEKAKFGPLVTVLDQVRQAGITAFSVETKPRPTGK
jgi:biopolymer transport protein ExbD